MTPFSGPVLPILNTSNKSGSTAKLYTHELIPLGLRIVQNEVEHSEKVSNC